jgi:hypothetical protein
MRKEIVKWVALAILVAGVTSILMGQAVSNKKSPNTRIISAAANSKPDPSGFRTYEDYVEALASWTVDQKVVTTGKQVMINTPPIGRYQIVFNPNVRADTFLIDTQTGKTWVATHISDVEGDQTIWLFRDRADDEQEFSDWLKRQTPKPKNK